MKIRNCMALIGAVVALSACGRTVIVREKNSSEGTSSAVIEPVAVGKKTAKEKICLLYTSPSPRDGLLSRMPSSA